MYISIDINSLRKMGSYETRLDALKEAGFDAYDFSMFHDGVCPWLHQEDYIAKAKAVRAYADKLGIVCNQAHAPMPLVFEGDEKQTAEQYDKIIRALEITRILGGKFCVVHPGNHNTAEQNAEIYKRMEPTAKKLGIKIALENMFNWDEKANCACHAACCNEQDFLAHLSLLDGDTFVALVDTGHAELRGLGTNAARLIRALGSRVAGLHMHDNDLWRDMHTLPFVIGINFAAVIEALREINYKGDITLECEGFLAKFPLELMPAALKFMASVADYFRTQVQA